MRQRGKSSHGGAARGCALTPGMAEAKLARMGMYMRKRLAAALIGICAVAQMPVAGGEPQEAPDPFEPVNRTVFLFNAVLDRALVRPLARGYARVVPGPARRGARNALRNLREPRSAVSQVLQLRPAAAACSMGRFVVNTTAGVGGLFDAAAALGLERREDTLGGVLERWGVGAGPYLVLPLAGPTTLRDGVGALAGWPLQPQRYLDSRTARIALGMTSAVSARADLLHVDALLAGVDDPYAFLRDARFEGRRFEAPEAAARAKQPPQPKRQ